MEPARADRRRRRDAIADVVSHKELADWVEDRSTDQEQEIDALQVQNGALLCSLLRRQASIPASTGIAWESPGDQDTNWSLFMEEAKAMARQRGGSDSQETLQRIKTAVQRRSKTDLETLFQFVKDFSMADSILSPTKASGIPRLAKKRSGIVQPSKLSRIHRLQAQPSLAMSQEDPEPSNLTTDSLSSDLNTTPSKLARFRDRVWAKRPRDPFDSATAALLTPKRRRTLFGDPAATREEDNERAAESEMVATDVFDRQADAAVATASQPSEEDLGDEELALRRQQEVDVAHRLRQELVRDNARMRLKCDSLRDDIDYYYALLAKMEQMALAFREAGAKDGTHSELAAGILNIISAPKVLIAAPEVGVQGSDAIA